MRRGVVRRTSVRHSTSPYAGGEERQEARGAATSATARGAHVASSTTATNTSRGRGAKKRQQDPANTSPISEMTAALSAALDPVMRRLDALEATTDTGASNLAFGARTSGNSNSNVGSGVSTTSMSNPAVGATGSVGPSVSSYTPSSANSHSTPNSTASPNILSAGSSDHLAGVPGAGSSAAAPAPFSGSVGMASTYAPPGLASPTVPPLHFWSAIPQAVVDKVRTGQFVEFHLLLPADAVAPSQKQVLTLEDSGTGQLAIASQPRSAKRIDNFATWLEAWTSFAAIYTAAHPSRSGELLAYQHHLLKAHQQFTFAAVADYDRSFRASIANSPALRWDAIPQSLYTTIFNAQAVRPFRAASAAASGAAPSPGACFLFNRGSCRRKACQYAHICSACGASDHPKPRCPAK